MSRETNRAFSSREILILTTCVFFSLIFHAFLADNLGMVDEDKSITIIKWLESRFDTVGLMIFSAVTSWSVFGIGYERGIPLGIAIFSTGWLIRSPIREQIMRRLRGEPKNDKGKLPERPNREYTENP